MLDYKIREAQAQEYYNKAMKRVKETPPPACQKFLPGTRVRIADDLARTMQGFKCSANATVVHTYAHAYGGNDVDSYCLDIDDHGKSAWYEEHQLTAIEDEENE